MGRACFDEYLSEIETDNLTPVEPATGETYDTDELNLSPFNGAQRRRAIEHYQERKRLRNDLEFFS